MFSHFIYSKEFFHMNNEEVKVHDNHQTEKGVIMYCYATSHLCTKKNEWISM